MTYVNGTDRALQVSSHDELSTLDAMSVKIADRTFALLDQLALPEQRADFVERLKAFIIANPKLSVRSISFRPASVNFTN